MTNFPVFDDKEKCDKYDPRYRPFYVETATPEAKDVVLVIDISSSMIGDKLSNAKEAAKTVLDTLNPKDKVSAIWVNSGSRKGPCPSALYSLNYRATSHPFEALCCIVTFCGASGP